MLPDGRHLPGVLRDASVIVLGLEVRCQEAPTADSEVIAPNGEAVCPGGMAIGRYVVRLQLGASRFTG
jgi:hypothetical protein